MITIKCPNIRTRPIPDERGIKKRDPNARCSTLLGQIDTTRVRQTIVFRCHNCKSFIQLKLADGYAELGAIDNEGVDLTNLLRCKITAYKMRI